MEHEKEKIKEDKEKYYEKQKDDKELAINGNIIENIPAPPDPGSNYLNIISQKLI
jgi:hypothetical protein